MKISERPANVKTSLICYICWILSTLVFRAIQPLKHLPFHQGSSLLSSISVTHHCANQRWRLHTISACVSYSASMPSFGSSCTWKCTQANSGCRLHTANCLHPARPTGTVYDAHSRHPRGAKGHQLLGRICADELLDQHDAEPPHQRPDLPYRRAFPRAKVHSCMSSRLQHTRSKTLDRSWQKVD